MRILFVARANSIHTARWLHEIQEQKWDIHLFPVQSAGVHSELRDVTVHNLLNYKPPGLHKSVCVQHSWPISSGLHFVGRQVERVIPNWRARWLAHTIDRLQPDVVHTLGTQHGGYLALEARKYVRDKFPPWILSLWGSDFHLFHRLPEHAERLNAILSQCDYIIGEGQRDDQLVRQLGFKNTLLANLPAWGSIDPQWRIQYGQPGPTSARRTIAVKGYQGWYGRALVALRAIELCADQLQGYCINVYSGDQRDVRIAAQLLSHATGLQVELLPEMSHAEMLQVHGQARISIGLAISDGLPAAMCEAMVMGSFPIQSHTSCAAEWFEDGVSGSLVHPEDPEAIAAAIRRAVTDDALVDRAAEINAQTIAERAQSATIHTRVIENYARVVADNMQAATGPAANMQTAPLRVVT